MSAPVQPAAAFGHAPPPSWVLRSVAALHVQKGQDVDECWTVAVCLPQLVIATLDLLEGKVIPEPPPHPTPSQLQVLALCGGGACCVATPLGSRCGSV